MDNFARACGVKENLKDYEKETIEEIRQRLFCGGEKRNNGQKYIPANISTIPLSRLFTCVYVKNVETKNEIKTLFKKHNLTDIKFNILPLDF